MSQMHHFAVYDRETGAVLRLGRGTAPDLASRQKLGPGEAVFAGKIDPASTYLPLGMPTPKPFVAPVVTALRVKAHAGRILSYSDWYVTRQQEGGAAIPAEVLAYRQAVRDASNQIEAMSPIPVDFTDPRYWPVSP